MAKTKLTEKEKTALLVVIKKELETIFEDLDIKIKDFDKAKIAVIDNLSYIIKKGLKTDPETNDLYEMFN